MKQSNASPIHGGHVKPNVSSVIIHFQSFKMYFCTVHLRASIYMTIEIVKCLMKFRFYQYAVLTYFRERYTQTIEQNCILINVPGANL